MFCIMVTKQPILQSKTILLGIIIILLEVIHIQPYSITGIQEQQLEPVRALAANEWAPVVWLHPNEKFFPDDAHGFIKSTTHLINGEEKIHSPTDRNGRSYGNVKITPLREGKASWNTYLKAPIDSDCPNCPIPRFLFGKRPTDQESPQVYAVINSCLPPKRHLYRGRRTSKWNIINKHEIVSENNLFDSENNRSYALKEKIHNQNNFSYSEQINLTKTHNQNNFSYSEQINLTKTEPHATIHKNDSNTDIISSNMSSTAINAENLSNLSVTNSSSNLTSSHDGVFYNESEPKINYQLKEQDTKNSNNTLHTFNNVSSEKSYNPISNKTDNVNSSFALLNKPTNNLLKVLLTRDKRVTNYTNTDITTETTDEPTRTSVTDEVQDRSIIDHGDHINPHHSPYNHISQNLSSHNTLLQKQRFSVTYWMFYPYNHGKKICSINLGWLGKLFKPRVNGVCHGQEVVLGNHIGDWEHISIDFIDSTPETMYISSHNFGAFYKYNPDKHLFYYTHQDIREGMNLEISFPDIVYMEDNHPVLYSALGSHGLWSKPGVHQYSGIPHLYDVTASGDQWRTWENLDVIDLRNEDALYRPNRWWLGYEGRWGNPSSNCHALLGGHCQQSTGPTGIPRKRVNFPCGS